MISRERVIDDELRVKELGKVRVIHCCKECVNVSGNPGVVESRRRLLYLKAQVQLKRRAIVVSNSIDQVRLMN